MYTVHTVTTLGLKPQLVNIEISATSGIPEIVLIGLANKTILEAKDRVITALKHWRIKIKARKIVINLQPADLKKTGSHYDLAIAVGLLHLLHDSQIPVKNAVFLGELSLDGSLRPLPDAINKVQAAKKLGFTTVFLPIQNTKEASLVSGITIKGLTSISQLLTPSNLAAVPQFAQAAPTSTAKKNYAAFDALQNQERTKRAITIALSGHHHLHVIGPPGLGKTTIINAAATLIPPINQSQVIEVLSIYEAADLPKTEISRLRSPSSQASFSQILGSARSMKPGEVSLAHHGILFLDEINQMSIQVLYELRKIIDEKKVILHNASTNSEYPADFLLLAASNPCPCGYWGSTIRACKCTQSQRAHFNKKLSGPLLDRIDLQVHTDSQKSEEAIPQKKLSAQEAQRQISSALKSQAKRYQGSQLHYNADLGLDNYIKYCQLTLPADNILTVASTRYSLSYRSIEKVIAVAQTIADLSESNTIQSDHVKEALSYRFEPHWSL